MRGKTAHTVRREGRFTPAPTPYRKKVGAHPGGELVLVAKRRFYRPNALTMNAAICSRVTPSLGQYNVPAGLQPTVIPRIAI